MPAHTLAPQEVKHAAKNLRALRRAVRFCVRYEHVPDLDLWFDAGRGGDYALIQDLTADTEGTMRTLLARPPAPVEHSTDRDVALLVSGLEARGETLSDADLALIGRVATFASGFERVPTIGQWRRARLLVLRERYRRRFGGNVSHQLSALLEREIVPAGPEPPTPEADFEEWCAYLLAHFRAGHDYYPMYREAVEAGHCAVYTRVRKRYQHLGGHAWLAGLIALRRAPNPRRAGRDADGERRRRALDGA